MFISAAVLILDVVMYAANWADCSMHLGWGWDCRVSAWIPLFIGSAAIVIFSIMRFLRRGKWLDPT